MNRSKRLPSLGAVALVAACSDGLATEPRLEPEVAAPTYGIELGSVSTGHNNGSESVLDIAVPAVKVGDVLIAQVVVAKLNGSSMATAQIICSPAGWVSIRRTNNRADREESDISQETFVFVATAAAPATNYQWSFRSDTCAGSAVNKSASGAIAGFTGVNPNDPIDVHAGNVGTGAPAFSTPNVITTVDGAHVLGLVGVRTDTQVWFNGVNTVYSVGSSSGDPRTVAGGDFSQSSAGATGAGSFRFGSAGADAWVGQTIALRPLHELEILIRDTFSRFVADAWGTADIGGAWFVNRRGPEFRVDGSTAIVETATDSMVYHGAPRLLATYGLNVAGLTSFSIDRTPDDGHTRFHTVQVYARRNDRLTDGDNYYRYRVRIFGSKAMDIRLEKTVNAVPAFLTDSVPLATTFSPGARYWIRWEAIGTSPATTVRMRVWQDGEPEPRTWQASAVVDERGLDFPGTSGYRFQSPSTQLTWPIRFSVDDFLYVER